MEQDYWKHLTQMDADSFRDLMITYGRDVWNFAYFLTGRTDLADDVSQDVFLKAYQGIGNFRGESTVRTWLFAIAKHISINYKRSAFVRKVILAGWVRSKETVPGAEAVAMDRMSSEDIWAIVMSLPVKYREVLILHAKYGMSMKEMAEVLEISDGTVKSRLSRARRRVSDIRGEGALYEQ